MRTSSHRIDLGLAILSLRKDRRPRTLEEIAAYCDCHNTTIDKIAQRALKKLRHKLKHIQLENPSNNVHKLRTT